MTDTVELNDVPTTETHLAVKVCHGASESSPVLFVRKEDFNKEFIYDELYKFGFVNKEDIKSDWFDQLQQGVIVFGTQGTKTVFNKSLQLIPFPDMETLEQA